MNFNENGKANGVGAPQIASITGGGIDFMMDPEIPPLRVWIAGELGVLSALAAAIQADASAPPYATAWQTNLLFGPNGAATQLNAIDSKLGELSTAKSKLDAANAALAQAQSQLQSCQTQLTAALAAAKGGAVVPKSTQAPGVYVSAPAAAGIAAGSGILGGVIGWWARGRGKRSGR
jgi:hypothetical protein